MNPPALARQQWRRLLHVHYPTTTKERREHDFECDCKWVLSFSFYSIYIFIFFIFFYILVYYIIRREHFGKIILKLFSIISFQIPCQTNLSISFNVIPNTLFRFPFPFSFLFSFPKVFNIYQYALSYV